MVAKSTSAWSLSESVIAKYGFRTDKLLSFLKKRESNGEWSEELESWCDGDGYRDGKDGRDLIRREPDCYSKNYYMSCVTWALLRCGHRRHPRSFLCRFTDGLCIHLRWVNFKNFFFFFIAMCSWPNITYGYFLAQGLEIRIFNSEHFYGSNWGSSFAPGRPNLGLVAAALSLKIERVLSKLGWAIGLILPRSFTSGRKDNCGLDAADLIKMIRMGHFGILLKEALVTLAVTF